MKLMMLGVLGASTVLMSACASEPTRVRTMASNDISCDASRVTVTKTQQGGYILDDRYEAQGCGHSVSYACGRVYVLLVPTSAAVCFKDR